MSTTGRIMRWTALRGRASGVLLICALLAGVLVATIGTGYTASRSLLNSGGAHLAKGQNVAYVNAESRKVESEAPGVARGNNPIEIVTLADGRVAALDKRTNQVWLIDPGTMQPEGRPIDYPDPVKPKVPPGEPTIVVVPAPDSGYLGSGDLVAQIDQDGRSVAQVKLPAKITGPVVPDAVEGLWALLEGGQVVHAARGEVRDTVRVDSPIEHLTIADGHPIGITNTGGLFNLSTRPPRTIGHQAVPHGAGVVVGSAKGAGRWILVLDTASGHLVAVDVQTGTMRDVDGLPTGRTYDQPVQVGDRAYIPDYTKHLLHVIDIGLGRRLDPIEVPGEADTFALEVRVGRVWANDQFDRRVRVIGDDGKPDLIDKGEGPGVETDTHPPRDSNGRKPDPDDETKQPESPQSSQDHPPAPPQSSKPEPAPQPKPEPEPKPEQMIAVPRIEPGTPIDQACPQIRQAGLTCVPVAVGDGGKTDSVVDQNPTDPPAGAPVPRSFRVVVRHYGPTKVPNVIGQYTDNACSLLTGAKLKCNKQPRPDTAPQPADLDIVKDQNPQANTDAATDTDVTISYFNKAPMNDYVGQAGASACMAFKQTYRKIDCQVVEGLTVQQTGGKQAGTVYAQQPGAGATVQMGESTAVTVTFTVVKGSPPVPPVTGQTPENACTILESQGYGCERREDQLARHREVIFQEPAPGTPMDPGGTVIIHYAPYEPIPLHRYQRNNGDPVYLLRPDTNVHPDYTVDLGVIGYGYPPGAAQPGSAPAFDHYCTGSTATCFGFSRNHYVGRDWKPYFSGWQVQSEAEALRVINILPASCGAGMVPIYRVRNMPNLATHKYSIQTAPGGDYHEDLGCLWR